MRFSRIRPMRGRVGVFVLWWPQVSVKTKEPRMNTNRHEFSAIAGVLSYNRRISDSCSLVSIRGLFLPGFLANSPWRFQFE